MDERKPFANLILSVIFVFAFGSIAMAADIAFYVGAVPGGAYPEATMNKDVKNIIRDTGALFKDVQKFATILMNLGNGRMPIWVMANSTLSGPTEAHPVPCIHLRTRSRMDLALKNGWMTET